MKCYNTKHFNIYSFWLRTYLLFWRKWNPVKIFKHSKCTLCERQRASERVWERVREREWLCERVREWVSVWEGVNVWEIDRGGWVREWIVASGAFPDEWELRIIMLRPFFLYLLSPWTVCMFTPWLVWMCRFHCYLRRRMRQ